MNSKGAQFFRCDFQVHSPRDLNWRGKEATTDDERKEYSTRFISACRSKGLDAVAITDHHDLVFFPFIKEAAANELDENNESVAEADQIVVFPGMELTLGVPCQALLILDADFPIHLLSSIPTILGVAPSNANDPKHGEVLRLEKHKEIGALCSVLDQHEYLKGHYIVLPNVGESGNFSLIRKGFAAHYKEMPCVGGYVDGFLTKLGKGRENIISGTDPAYGKKAVGVFQTSDNRNETFAELGTATSWVKWATPTAEALRQACLARVTRIANEEPQFPSIIVDSLNVSNSKFLGPIDLALNSQFNSLIGGRGTGKSTILEYLRWALGDQPPEIHHEEIPDVQKKRHTLIENTLKPFKASVTVNFLLNGVQHAVRRHSDTNKVLLKVGENEFKDSDEKTIRDLLPIQAYSQKQLSTVGVRTDELTRFVKSPIARELLSLATEEDDLKSKIRTAYTEIESKRTIQLELERERIEASSLQIQIGKMQSELKGLGPQDLLVLAEHEQFLNNGRFVREIDRTIQDWKQSLTTARNDIFLPDEIESVEEDKNKEIRQEILKLVSEVHDDLTNELDQLIWGLSVDAPKISSVAEITKGFREKINKHNSKYEEAKSRSSSHSSKVRETSELERRKKILTDSIADKEHQLKKLGQPEEKYKKSRDDWAALYSERAALLEERCKVLSEHSKHQIRAKVKMGSGTDLWKEEFTSVLTGSRVRGRKVEDLCVAIEDAEDSIVKFTSILDELEELAWIDTTNEAGFNTPSCPNLREAGFSPGDIEKIAIKLSVNDWLELSLVPLRDTPTFEYRQREEDYISFADASAGQQATSLIKVLLNQEGPPLIIDQPEEDLDNNVILNVVEDIWTAKSKRQIIFASHNANIVVNGDSDLVICCDYRTAGDQSGGRVKITGAIDIDEVRTEITEIMEGGRGAFQLRKEKYGF